jgi:hypothetical protein
MKTTIITNVTAYREQAVKEDQGIITWWRDGDKWAQVLVERREILITKRGEWQSYLDDLGLGRTQAYKMLHSVEETLSTPIKPRGLIVPNGTINSETPSETQEGLEQEEDQNSQETVPVENTVQVTTTQEVEDAVVITPEQEAKEAGGKACKDEKEAEKEFAIKLPKKMPEEYLTLKMWADSIKNDMELGRLIRSRVSDLERQYNDNYPEWTEFSNTYFEFFEKLNGEKPNMQQKDWGNMKRLIVYLRGLGAGDAVANWKAILSKWDRLDKFYQNRTDFSSIYSQINNIITQLKHGNSKSTIGGADQKVELMQEYLRKEGIS